MYKKMGKVFLDKINPSAHIETVVAEENLKNGQFLKLGLLGDDGESRLVTKPKTELEAHVFLADAPLSYGHPDFDLATYEVKAGKAGRAYHLTVGDVISVTPDLADGVKVGDRLTIGKDGFGFAKAADGKGIGLCIAKEYHGFDGDVLVIAVG